MRIRSAATLMMLIMWLSSCSGDVSAEPRSPNQADPDGLWLMVMNDCEGDCEEPGIGMGGRYYYVISCEPIDEVYVGERVAIPDPESVVTVVYEMARPIDGIDIEQALAIGPQAPTACEDRSRSGWFAARSMDHLLSDQLSEQLARLSPNG